MWQPSRWWWRSRRCCPPIRSLPSTLLRSRPGRFRAVVKTPSGKPLGVFLSALAPLARLLWAGLLAVCLGALIAPDPARADDYLDELKVRSRELRLHERREWHRLLHYITNLARPGVHGLADAPRFYLAPNGKTNPQAELEEIGRASCRERV